MTTMRRVVSATSHTLSWTGIVRPSLGDLKRSDGMDTRGTSMYAHLRSAAS